jgi:hypothetical protein
MTNATLVAQNIINNIQSALRGTQCPTIMMENILDRAQTIVNDEGFVWDVALAMACKMYTKTQHAALYAYEA